MDNRQRVPGCLVTAALGLCLCVPAVRAHPGQSVDLRFTIDEEEVRYVALFSADFLASMMPQNRVNYSLSKVENRYEFADLEMRDAFEKALYEMLADPNPVTVDGVLVKPIIKDFAFVSASMPGYPSGPTTMPPDLNVTVVHPVKGKPRQVSLVWGLFPQDPGRMMFGLPTAVEVVAQLDAFDENKMIVFTEEEPEVVWHAPAVPVKKRVTPVVVKSEPKRMSIPVASVAIVGVWVLLLGVMRFTPAWPRVGRKMLIGSVVPIVVAAGLYNVAVAEVRPPWEPLVKLPTPDEAEGIFASLHRNVYRAFDYKREGDIYDVLEQSVDGPLLDDIYNEVYQSLILRDQGGAVARIQSVDVLDSELASAGQLEASGAAAFRIQSRWRVIGAVYHWGHVHSRTNEYKAQYTVAQRGDRWKITGVEMLEQRRIVKPDDDPMVEMPDLPEEPM